MQEWLDEASKRKLRTRMAQNPGLTYAEFLRELNKEVSLGANANQRHRWKNAKLRLQDGQITFNGWREFQSSLEESLQGFQPPPEVYLLEQLIAQVPTHIKREVASREVGALRQTYWVILKNAPRGITGQRVGSGGSGVEPTA